MLIFPGCSFGSVSILARDMVLGVRDLLMSAVCCDQTIVVQLF